MEILLLAGLAWLLSSSSSSAARRRPAAEPPLLERVRRMKAAGATDRDTWAALALGGDGVRFTNPGTVLLAPDGWPRMPQGDVFAAIESLKAPPSSSSSDRGPIGAFGLYVPDWPRRPTPEPRTNACVRRGRPVCYRTKSDALNVFREHNAHVLESAGGGLNYRDATGDMFDPVNHKYGLEGRRKVKTMKEAIWIAMPAGAPFCLDRLDLAVLNELAPARRAGGFRLPEHVYEDAGGQESYYRGRGDPPF